MYGMHTSTFPLALSEVLMDRTGPPILTKSSGLSLGLQSLFPYLT